jgi:quinol monooxygenase YgiN
MVPNKEVEMLHTTYTAVIDSSPDLVWQTIRSFRAYEWGEGVEPGVIEGGRPDNEIGSVRAFRYYGSPSRQRLTAHSDAERSYSWESCAPYETIEHYTLTIKVEPEADGRSNVVWSADYDAPAAEAPKWDAFFKLELAKSLEKLRRIVAASKVALFVTHKTRPGKRDEVRRVWERHMAPAIAANAGHSAYFYCFDLVDPDAICAFQQYASPKAARDFLETAAYAAYLEEVEPLLAGPPRVTTTKPIWTKHGVSL